MTVDKIIEEILTHIRAGQKLNADKINAIIRAANKGEKDNSKHYAKKFLLPFYLKEKAENSDIFKA